MKKSKVTVNLFYNTVYQILILIVPFVTTPYVSRVLHPEGVGTYSVTTAIAKYFWMFALLGMQNYGNRRIAAARDNEKELSTEFSNLYCFQLMISTAVSAAYMVYIALIGWQRYDIVALCQIPYILSAVLEVSWFFYGTEQFKFMVVRNGLIKILTAAAVFAFVKNERDVWIYALVNSISLFLGQLCLWPFIMKRIRLVKPKWKKVAAHLKPNMVLFVSVVAVSVYTLMDKIMIETLSNRIQVGYYENTEKMLNMCIGVVGAIGAVMLPRISYLMSKREEKQVLRYLSKSMRYIMILAIAIAFGLAGIAREFAVVFFGDEYVACGVTIMTISLAVIFYSWENILRTQYLLPGNRDEVFVKGTVYAAVSNLVLNAIFIPYLGAEGAVIGTVGAQFAAATYQSLRIRKEIPLFSYLKELIPSVLAGTLTFFVCRVTGRRLGNSIATILLQVAFGGMTYLGLMFVYLFLLKDELVFHLLHRKPK